MYWQQQESTTSSPTRPHQKESTWQWWRGCLTTNDHSRRLTSFCFKQTPTSLQLPTWSALMVAATERIDWNASMIIGTFQLCGRIVMEWSAIDSLGKMHLTCATWILDGRVKTKRIGFQTPIAPGPIHSSARPACPNLLKPTRSCAVPNTAIVHLDLFLPSVAIYIIIACAGQLLLFAIIVPQSHRASLAAVRACGAFWFTFPSPSHPHNYSLNTHSFENCFPHQNH